MKYKLLDLLTEYKETNKDSLYEPVAVGKYGIRKRNEIYKKELSDDYSKNKVIRNNTLIVGMGSNQIDIGVLSEDKIYSVSPAYHTYRINIQFVSSDYLDLLFKANNANYFKKYSIATARQGKKIDLKSLLNEIVDIPSFEEQDIIIGKIFDINELIRIEEKSLSLLDELTKSRFNEMFSADFPLKRIDKVCSLKSGTTFDKRYELTEGTMLYCKVSDMNLIGNEKYLTISKTYVDRNYGSKFAIPKNSVVFPKRGGAIGTNKKRITKDDTCVDLNTMGVTPSKALTIEYLYQYFQNIDLLSLCDGSIIPQLNNKNIGPLIIKVPPIVLQSEFASFVEQIDKLKFSI